MPVREVLFVMSMMHVEMQFLRKESPQTPLIPAVAHFARDKKAQIPIAYELTTAPPDEYKEYTLERRPSTTTSTRMLRKLERVIISAVSLARIESGRRCVSIKCKLVVPHF